MDYLLDTNILSELRKGSHGNESVRKWAWSVRSERHYISVLTLGEIRKGIEKLRLRAPDQCGPFDQWIDAIQTQYAETLLPVTDQICDKWGHLCAKHTLPAIDGLLAATALCHHLTIATRNVVDFVSSGADIVNPFDF